MDNQYNQQTNTNPYPQQGNAYQQGNPYQQQGNAYQQGNPYQQQGNAYQQGNSYQQQGNYYQQGNGYGNYNGGGNSESQKAPNIFQQFALAFVPTKYDRLTKVKTGSMIGFVIVLVLAATLISAAFSAVDFASFNMEEVVEKLPDFTITGGRLYMDEDFLYDDGSVFVYMTEDIDTFSYDDVAEVAVEGYQDIILMGRDRISVMQDGEYAQLDFSDFSDFGDTLTVSRERIASLMGPFLIFAMIFAYLFIFIGMGLGYFLFAAVYLLFAMLIAVIMKKQIETGALFRVAIYSKVLMFVVAGVLRLSVNWPVPFLLRVAITMGFMAFAIAKLPDNRPTPMPMQPMGPGMGQWGQGGQNGQGWQ